MCTVHTTTTPYIWPAGVLSVGEPLLTPPFTSAMLESERLAIIEEEKKGEADNECGTNESGDGTAPRNDAAGVAGDHEQNRVDCASSRD